MSFIKQDIKHTPRKEQTDCLNWVMNILENEPDKKFFLLDLPTGVGKSMLNLMIIDSYTDNINKNAKFDLLTSSKLLQQQYVDEFKSLSNLWGRDNYQCSQYNCSCAEGKEFSKIQKTKCEECPYDKDKESYLFGKVSLTNYHMYMIYQLYQQELVSSRNSEVLIVDEAHELEDVVSGFLSISINEFIFKKFKFKDLDRMISELKRISSIEDFIEFANDCLIEQINRARGELASSLVNVSVNVSSRDNKFSKLTGEGKNKDFKTLELISELEQYKSKIEGFIKDYNSDPSNWVLEKSFNKNKNVDLSVEPVWVHSYLDKYIFSKYKKVIFMSGTILDKEIFSYLYGLDPKKSSYYKIDSPFPLKNRPIIYMPLGKMNFTNKDEIYKRYLPYIEKILDKYKDKKGVIHTVTYELSEWLKRDIKNDRLIFHSNDSKDIALRKHMNSEDPTVVVSPSMGTGVDFEGDKARFQIMMKVPYPSLASQKNKMRQKINPKVYTYKTICTLLQCYGRGIRNYEDNAHFIILDGCFGDLLKYSSSMFPTWALDAIKKIQVNITN